MSQNNRNSNPIYLIGAIAGIISAIVTVLTYLEIKPSFINPSVVISAPRVDWKKATLATTLTGHSSSVSSVAIGPDGKTLASGSRDKTIKIWSLETFREIATLKHGWFWSENSVESVAFSPDGKTLASGGDYRDKTIKIWSLETFRQITTLNGNSFSVNSVAFSPDGKTLVSGSADKTIKILRAGSSN